MSIHFEKQSKTKQTKREYIVRAHSQHERPWIKKERPDFTSMNKLIKKIALSWKKYFTSESTSWFLWYRVRANVMVLFICVLMVQDVIDYYIGSLTIFIIAKGPDIAKKCRNILLCVIK